MYKVNYEESGRIIGYYHDSIEYKTIPEPYIEITDEQRELMYEAEAGKEWAIINGVPAIRDIIFKMPTDERTLNTLYIPSESRSIAAFVKSYMKAVPPTDDAEKLVLSGLYERWTAGKYAVGDIRNHAGQTWECHQAHDNAVYPDITPENPQTWATFWRPLHGKNKETARPWVKPENGTTDMYHAGEYMVYTDGKVYRCKRDTVYSPEEHTSDWAVA